MPNFTLELLHVTDQEASSGAVVDAPSLSAVLNALREQDLGNDGIADNTLTLSSGDAFIPGLFYSAGAEVFGSAGIADVQIQNELGFQAIALGNHEFDFGTGVLAGLIDGSAPGDVFGVDFGGTDFPYLSANLDFSTDAALSPLAVAGGQAPQGNVVTSSTILTVDNNGSPERIAVVGATTPTLDRISSSGDVTILPGDFNDNPTSAQLDALAAEIQAEVNTILAANGDIDKVVLLAHMQRINIETELAARLTDVDIIVAGGSNTRLLDENDRLRPGDSNQGVYPTVVDDADGNPTAIVNTDGSYKYVGRLVIEFDANGRIIPASYDSDVSGAYATDAGGFLAVLDGLPTGVEMSEAQEVTPTPDTAATGTFDVTAFDPDTLEVTITGNYANLSSALRPVGGTDSEGNGQSAIHLHVGAPGENGGIIRNFDVTQTDARNGTFTGTFQLTEAEAGAVLVGGAYVNLHTNGNPGGELRGQVTFETEAGSSLLDLVDPEVVAIANAIGDQITLTESNVFGISDVFLNGNRSGSFDADDPDGVRTQETNLGNLTADANLAAAQAVDKTVVVSIKNGGGIRASIGETVVPAGGVGFERTPNEAVFAADGTLIKPEGGISQTDIQTALAFNNELSLLTVTRAELVAVLEHGVAALPDVSGRFPQVSGVQFSFDEDLPAGDRIVNAAIVDEDGTIIAELVKNGEITGNPSQPFRIVTLNFMAEGGDGYPFPTGAGVDRVDLTDLDGNGVDDEGETGSATFAFDGTEQDALAEYLADNFMTTPYGDAEVGPEGDLRIQNVTYRPDTVLIDSIEDISRGDIELEFAQRYDSGAGEAGSEVVGFENGLVVVTNGAENRIDIFDAETGALERSIDLTFIGGYDGVQSVAIKNGIIAAAIARPDAALGAVAFFNLDGVRIGQVAVGNLPDNVSFTPDGTKVLVANEGEALQNADPGGSVSIIDISNGVNNAVETRLNFANVDLSAARIISDRGDALDVEPEYIATNAAGTRAYVSLQEANAYATIDLTTNTVIDVKSFGTVDHSLPGNEIDTSDRDGTINITSRPLKGLRMPDAIDTFESNGVTYLVTANEGDSRDLDGDEIRLGDAADDGLLDPALLAQLEADGLLDNGEMGRINISAVDGDTDGDGDIDELFSYGSRSFTIFNADTGEVVFDSGSEFARIIANINPLGFNDDEGSPDENRSDNKGSEPEAITVGVVDGKTLAFIGLERDSGIMVYDVTDPANSEFVTYLNGREDGDVSPETLKFVAPEDSPTGFAQIIAAYEISGTTVAYDIKLPLDLRGTGADNVLRGGASDDLIRGFGGDDALFGAGGDDDILGGIGNDLLVGGLGADNLDGGAGIDRVGFEAPVILDLGAPELSTGEAAGDTYTNVEIFVGSDGDDDLRGDAGDNTLNGGDGDDIVQGRDGNDVLNGGRGADILLGGAGNDRFIGSPDGDVMIGGDGFDRVMYSYGDAVTVDLADSSANAGGAAGDRLVEVEGVVGSDFADTISGDAADNFLFGRGGNDVLNGRDGSDILIGGAGNDTLTGGADADFFLFRDPSAGRDMITDFEGGVDTVQFTGAAFGGLAAGDLSAANFRTGAGALDANDFFIYNASNGVLLFDADGNGAGDAVRIAEFSGAPVLTAPDIEIV